MSTKPPDTLSAAIDGLFDNPPMPRDIALQLLNSWIANLQATETWINRQLLALFTIFVGFLALDTGVLAKLTFQGVELERTGLVLCVVPLTLAYFYYRFTSQIYFVHDLRTAIALLYKKLHAPVYYGYLDMLTHIASIRNLESYDSLHTPSTMRFFYDRTTDVVTIILLIGPLFALIYCIVRLWSYPDIGIALWIATTMLSIIFVIRALLFGLGELHQNRFHDDFGERKKISSTN
jgi:hypothetical protein